MNLKDILSHLDYRTACKLLGPEGDRLIRRGGKWDIDPAGHVSIDSRRLVVQVGAATVTVEDDPAFPKRLHFTCSACDAPCEHMGAAFSFVLEEKMLLGLAAPPPEDVPMESLTEAQLLDRALKDRETRAEEEKMDLESSDGGRLWSDYVVTSRSSGKSYRVALRGWERGESYCSCPDFKSNTLGTCKHILFALEEVRKRFPEEEWRKPYRRRGISLHIRYGETAELRLLVPDDPPPELLPVIESIRDRPITDVPDLLERIKIIEASGHSVNVYPDAEEYINGVLTRRRLEQKMAELRQEPEHHPLRRELLSVELLPYQLDGIAFAVAAGRAVLADDMGLGKTIQGIGVAEMLRREVGISRVLVVCPASVKGQWRQEIARATDLDCQIVLGGAEERAEQYDAGAFFIICNYEQVLRDIMAIEKVRWDLIILDEGQRIKNWQAKTSQTIKSLRSPFALVLSGTPLENRLDELYSVVQFIDARRLGPAFRFFHRHRVVDEKGKVLGYKNLGDLRKRLEGVMLRRTRAGVMKQLPPKNVEILRIPPTDEQMELHHTNQKIISTILNKKYITEMDLLRLQKALLLCRMTADSTYLVDKQEPGYSSKLEEIGVLLEQLLGEEGRKIILFSEWTTMLDLIQPMVERLEAKFIRLQGSVPQKKRLALMHAFQTDRDCRLFMSTNAGATGLNLQAADTVINVDLPWNPAVLEQRIARAHRMGQRRPVQVYLLVTEETIEEGLLNTLAVKKELAMAALDASSQVENLSFTSGVGELRRRLEVLIGEKPEAPIDESRKEEVARETALQSGRRGVVRRRRRILRAAFALLGRLVGRKARARRGPVPAAAAGARAEARAAPGVGRAAAEARADPGPATAAPQEPETPRAAETARYMEMLSKGLRRKRDGSLEVTIRLQDQEALEKLARSLSAVEEGR